MSIKYAVLGLIAEEPRHGYAVRAAFEERLGDFWELNYGQVYQVLAALEAEGFIAGTDEQVGRRPRRTVYAVSAKGRDALRVWLAQTPSVTKPFRDAFYVRLLFLNEDALLPQIVKARVDACERRVAELVDQRRLHARTSAERKVRWLFIETAILHAEADRKAAELCQKLLIEGREPAGRGSGDPSTRLQQSDDNPPRKLRARP